MTTPRTPVGGFVLVVEDDSDQAAVLGLWLRKAGYQAELLPEADCLPGGARAHAAASTSADET